MMWRKLVMVAVSVGLAVGVQSCTKKKVKPTVQKVKESVVKTQKALEKAQSKLAEIQEVTKEADKALDLLLQDDTGTVVEMSVNKKELGLPFSLVFFEFDSDMITQDQLDYLEYNVNILQKNPNVNLYIIGHADPRGTEEYNYELGKRRALSVIDYYMSMGVSFSRLIPVSKGEMERACFENNEKCWNFDRRVATVVR